ncbi:hypothetical protein J2W42_004685 [Rhizobium tibeticum]|uniref:Uncharacterized protein n=1 Tax=Rhizobium tibeticum TaxID=501024 RepID=A0A1H8MIU6_9HYPH|nr:MULTISPECIES: hypothetical protein [Rhizobium]MCA0801847.1 hypothetical protein [Rhizobium sp. T1473]MCS0463425.1 hypothetical protein [Rhizobium favelukesii]MDP9811817.1 hypothetical protein [Rhizobium tibeticum]UFS84190.1 hypothetical protein LPB79_18765 [Rhizobium sp. T136]SEH91711.1 hypothetical protein RTCCBAU85039_3043 [Rhizobium tibeticum]
MSSNEAFKSRLTELGIVSPKHAKVRGLNKQQQELVYAYRLGKLDEKTFQFHLLEDPALAEWVRRVLEAASHDPLRK